MTVLCLAERDGDGIAALSVAALTFARSADAAVTAVLFGAAPAPPAVAELAACGVTAVARVPEPAGYAPVAWARSLEQLATARGASAVVAAATDRGGEVLAHLGALTGLPVAANCVSAAMTGPGSWRLVRQRWAGSVLEDATLAAGVALLTVAADAVAAAPGAVPAAPAADRVRARGHHLHPGADRR